MIARRALALRKSDLADDWFVIEWAQHARRLELREIPGGHALWSSARMSDADVEGTGAEMRAIAEAILAGGGAQFRRCAADVDHGDAVRVWSPRNSTEAGVVHIDDARDLARHILATVPA